MTDLAHICATVPAFILRIRSVICRARGHTWRRMRKREEKVVSDRHLYRICDRCGTTREIRRRVKVTVTTTPKESGLK